MNAIRKLTAWTNKTAALGLVAVSLAAFGTLVGPAPRVADIGTAWCAEAEKARCLSNDTGDRLKDSGDKLKGTEDKLAAKSDGLWCKEIDNRLGVDQL